MNSVSIANPEDFPRWKDHLRSKEGIVAFAQPEWLAVLRRAYGCRAELLVARQEGGEICGGLILYHYPAENRMLFTPPCAVIADTPHAEQELLDAVRRYAAENRVAASDVNFGLRCPATETRRSWTRTSFLLAIRDDEDAFWAALPSKARNTIRKARKQQLSFRTGPSTLDAWYEIYQAHCLQRRLPIHRKRYFSAILDQFGDNASLLCAYQGQRIIAGMLFLVSGAYAHYLFSASVPEALPLGANSLLMCRFADQAREKNVEQIELGESREGSGVYLFKSKQLGADIVPVHHADILVQSGRQQPTWTERVLYVGHRVWPALPAPLKRGCLRQMRPFHRLI